MRSARNRASEVVRGDRVRVAAAIVVGIAVVSGATIGLWRAHVARTQRAEVVGRVDQVREIARSVTGIADLPAAARGPRAHELLESLDRLAQNAGSERDLLRALGQAYEKLAAIESSGSTAGAIALQEKAIAMREQIASISSADLTDTQALASAYLAISQLHVASGAPQHAADYLQQALPLLESLLASNPTEQVRSLCATAYLNIGGLSGSRGNSAIGDTRAALAYIRGALKMQQALAAEFPQNLAYQQELATTYDALALVYSAMGEPEGALEQYRKAIAVSRGLVAAHPDDQSHRRLLAEQLKRTGNVLIQLNENAEAQEYFREAQTLEDDRAGEEPTSTGDR